MNCSRPIPIMGRKMFRKECTLIDSRPNDKQLAMLTWRSETSAPCCRRRPPHIHAKQICIAQHRQGSVSCRSASSRRNNHGARLKGESVGVKESHSMMTRASVEGCSTQPTRTGTGESMLFKARYGLWFGEPKSVANRLLLDRARAMCANTMMRLRCRLRERPKLRSPCNRLSIVTSSALYIMLYLLDPSSTLDDFCIAFT